MWSGAAARRQLFVPFFHLFIIITHDNCMCTYRLQRRNRGLGSAPCAAFHWLDGAGGVESGGAANRPTSEPSMSRVRKLVADRANKHNLFQQKRMMLNSFCLKCAALSNTIKTYQPITRPLRVVMSINRNLLLISNLHVCMFHCCRCRD